MFGELATNKSTKYNPKNSIGSVKCIELEHVDGGSGQILGYIDGRQTGSIKNVFKTGDVLFGKLRPYLRKYTLAPFDGVCSSEIWVLTGTAISNDFLYRLVQTEKFIDLANQSSGSKMPRADWSLMERGIFYFPSQEEQRKIAKFLSLLDERIATQNKIIENLETQIKTTMKIIFTMKAYDFKSCKLRLLCSIRKGEQINSSQLSESGIYSVINGGITPSGYHSYFNSEAETISISEGGNSCGYVQFNKKRFWSGGHCYTLIGIVPYIASKYLYYFLKYSEQRIMALRVGSGLPNIQKKDLENFEILHPAYEKQVQIVTYLDLLEKKIEVEKSILLLLTMQKQYLLANMFI